MSERADVQPVVRLPAWHVDVDGCTNFRDAGGWDLVDGGRMRSGRLYRSDGPLRLTARGRATVGELGIRLVVDLRQHSQHIRTPGFLGPELTAHVPLVDQVIDTVEPPPLDQPEDFTDLYDGMLSASLEPVAVALDLVSERSADGPVLVHCSFGKDRAGLVTALVQAAIGVTADSIITDYARSDDPARRRYEWMLAEPRPGDVDLSTVPAALFRAHPESMALLLDRMIERHGSLTAWAETFPTRPETVPRLRDALVDG